MTDAGPSSAPKPFKSLTTALITPSASPPISHPSRDLPPPAKRPRLASTPSSLPSLTRSTPGSSSSRTDEEIQDDRRHSALRLLNVWSQLQERYVRPLDEDDIIDFEHDVIIKDKGVLKKHKRIGFGLLADSMRGEGDASATDYEDEDEDVDEIDAFASVPDSTVHERLQQFKNIPRRRLPPIGEVDPADSDDLQAFLEANRRMQFDEEDDEGSIQDVLQALAERFSSDSGEEDADELEEGYTSFEENVHATSGASLPPPSSSPPSSPMITPGPRTYTDDDFSEDEFAKWEEEEVVIVDAKTPQPPRKPSPSPLHLPEVIDLTSPTPSPFNSPTRRPTTQPLRSKSPRSSPSKTKTPSKPVSRAKSQTPASSHSKTLSRGKSKTPISRVRSLSPPPLVPQTPVRAKSKTPAKRIRAVSPPPIASSSKVKLPTPSRSSSSLPSFSHEPTSTDNPFLDDSFQTLRSFSPLPPSSPIVSSVDPSPVKPRPKPRPRRKPSATPAHHSDSDLDDAFISSRATTVGKTKDKGDTRLVATPKASSSKPPNLPEVQPEHKSRKNRAEVVITRQPSRAPSLPPPRRTTSPKRSASKDPPKKFHPAPANKPSSIAIPTSSNKDKGKGRDFGVWDDSSPELQSKFAKNFTPFRSPSKEGSVDVGSPLPALMKRGYKRKRVLSFSSDSDSDVPLARSPLKRFSSPVKPISQSKSTRDKEKERIPSSSPKPSRKSPSPVKAKTRSPSSKPSSPKGKSVPKTKETKEKERPEVREKSPSKAARSNSKTPVSVKRPRAKTPEKSPEIISDSEPGSPSPPRRPSPKSRKSSLKAPSQSKSSPSTQSHSSSPQTPPRRRSQSQSHEQHHPHQQHLPFPAYPPMPSMPNFPAQDPQAQFHFAQAIHHLAFLMTGSTLNAGTPHVPYQIPWPAPAPHMPPQPSHRQTSRHGGEESSSPGAGSSRSRRDVMSTPTHTSHPYPYSYDPRWSSSTLPPSSPPRSSSPIVSSPPTSPVPLRPALRERSRSRGRRVSFKLGDDDRPHVRPGEDDDDEEVEDELLLTPDRLAILASPEIPVPSATRSRRGRSTESPSPGGSKGVLVEADDGRERGQTPGPPERSRSLARR